ncbi:hypothetical protein COLU111180_12745 [Cohnella lubricantis]|uniref:Uncharacterized protein n=1 Tax=Cohnella lubricantis TaxID=2163172 RepID=A0A841TDN2_9BACL|nr:hypothetical protein [Cohnella lubricantis]MBB6677438.1 hypothetical protein [Cohnella lubricantis]MBP2117514.1 hypothetical protein [Cohnella lubricantis]
MNAETSVPQSRMPTVEELEMIRDALLLPNIVIMLERQREELQRSFLMLKPLYLMTTDVLIASVNKDLSQLRMELRKRKIKTWEGEQSDFTLYIQYVCRGYESRFGIVREHAKAEVRVRLTKYIGEVFKSLST